MKREHRGSLAAGMMLILLGVLFLIVQLVPELQAYFTFSWPLIIVGIGVVMLILAVLAGVPGLAVPACVIGGIGAILYWQNTTGNWDSWAYAWTLIPGFVGLGVLLNGLLGGEDTRQAVSAGFWSILISLGLFVIFGSLFGAIEIGGRYWPVLLIVLGLLVFVKEAGHRGSIVGPVILIGLGIVLLLINLGVLSWNAWEVIFLLWPVLLVAAGLDILIGRRSALGSLLALALTLVLLVWLLWLYGADTGIGEAASTQISQTPDGASQATIMVNPAVGRLNVEALPESPYLVEGTIPQGVQGSVKRDFTVEDETANFTLKLQGVTFGPFVGGGARGMWNLGLNSRIPTQLKTELGVGETQVDLTNLTLRDVQVNTGVGQTTVILPNEGNFEARIEGAIGQTTVIVPRSMGVRIHLATGIAARQVPPDYQGHDDVYTSPGYEGADGRVELKVSQAIGNVTIRYPE
jgi:hypothetical protein